MNGGVFHATEFCSARELREAKEGYQYFGLVEALKVILRSEALRKAAASLGDYERELDAAYYRAAGDAVVEEHFKRSYEQNSDDYASVQ